MLKIGFCDDDLNVLKELQVLVDRYRVEKNREIEYAAFQSSLDLLAELEKGVRFDILFLDVLMPGQNGMEAAREIRDIDTAVKIIFLTSSPEYAVESYTVGAYFYQLKPIWQESFYRLMDSVIAECKKAEQRSLIMRCREGISRIELEKLMYCEVMGRTLQFYMEDGRVLESMGKLDDLKEQLSAYANFLRPHRSYLVNMDYIRTLSSKSIRMQNQKEIPIPHGKYSDIKNRYLEYVFDREQVVL